MGGANNLYLCDPVTRNEISKAVFALRNQGRFYDLKDARLDRTFHGSIDRFIEIAWRFDGRKRVLDVSSGLGMLLALLKELGHDCCGVDLADRATMETYAKRGVELKVCNAEVDPLPYDDNSFDAACCCQVLEHFTHSHLPAIREMFRVLKPGGIIELDVPNVSSFRNVTRILRGKNITWDYEKCYLHGKPILHAGHSFYPFRHNREFARHELELLLRAAGFTQIEVSYLKSRRHREGLDKLRSIGTAVRDLIPVYRKSLIAFGIKPHGGA